MAEHQPETLQYGAVGRVSEAHRTWVGEGGEVEVRRFTEPAGEPDVPGEGHLAVHEDTLDPGMLDLADVIWRYGDAQDPRLGPPQQWAAEVLARHPGCSLAAYVTGPYTCTVLHRSGLLAELTAPRGAEPALYASAFLADMSTRTSTRTGLEATGETSVFTVRAGCAQHRVESRLLGQALPADHVEIGEVAGGVLPAEQRHGLVDQP
jgi:hypothetical protein